MSRSTGIVARAEALLGIAVAATAPMAGGDVCRTTKLRLADGRVAVTKTLPEPPPGFFAREAAGLRWLGSAEDGVAVAEVLAAAEDCLILRWVEQVPATPDLAVEFGRRLARTHASGAVAFGSAEGDGFIGRLPLPNGPLPSWAEFYAEQRIAPYLRLARDRGALDDSDVATIEVVVGRLPAIVPEEPASRLHGDLWGGNVLWSATGVHLIDPAAYGGHREVDLAMLALFGAPHLPRTLAAYDEAFPLADGWADRVGVHQLFPLLVHACLFGGSYGARAVSLARRFG